MNTKQTNKIAMYRAVDALLTDAPETNGIAALAAALPLFRTKLDEIERLIATQRRPLRATIAERNQTLQEAVDATLALGGIALSYADQKRINGLAIKVRVTEGDFRRSRLDHRVRIAQQLHDAVQPIVAQLADHGVTAATLADLQAKIDAAALVLPAARGTSVDKKAATFQLAATIRGVDAMLENQLDPLLLPLRKTNPEFHARYRAARLVVDRPGVRELSLVPPAASPAAAVQAPTPEKLAA